MPDKKDWKISTTPTSALASKAVPKAAGSAAGPMFRKASMPMAKKQEMDANLKAMKEHMQANRLKLGAAGFRSLEKFKQLQKKGK